MLPQEYVELEVDPDPALEREAEKAAYEASDCLQSTAEGGVSAHLEALFV